MRNTVDSTSFLRPLRSAVHAFLLCQLILTGCGDYVSYGLDVVSHPLETRVSVAPIAALSGSSAIDDSGNATYATTLAVPPGRMGLHPNLSLVYSTSVRDGYLGQGFRLSGSESRLHRCGQTIAVDGEPGAVRFDDRDRLCLDGTRLVGPDSDAAYWADGTILEEEFGARRRIVREGDTFVVYERDGTRRVYGGDDATVEGNAVTRSVDGAIESSVTVDVEWRLAKVVDAHENYMHYHYTHVSHDGDAAYEHYLSSIRYTGSSELEPRREIRFAYQPRDNADIAYTGGVAHEITRQLVSIEMYVHGALERSYNMTYKLDEWTGRPAIASYTECGPFGNCRPATRLTWSSPSWVAEEPVEIMRTPSVWSAAGSAAQFLEKGDFNGDGRDDIVYWDETSTVSIGLFVRFGGVSGFSDPMALDHDVTWQEVVAPFFTPMPSGEDRDSLLLRNRGLSNEGMTWIHTQLRQVGAVVEWREGSSNAFDCGADQAPIVGDFTGTGAAGATIQCPASLQDIFGDWNQRVLSLNPAAYWNGSEYAYEVTQAASLSSSDINYAAQRIAIDLDGDRRDELLVLPPAGPDAPPAHLIDGVGTPRVDLPEVHLDTSRDHVFADLNGDSLADAVVLSEGTLMVQYNTGVGFAAPFEAFAFPQEWEPYLEEFGGSHVRVADFDRDGRQDLLLFLSDVDAPPLLTTVLLRWDGQRFNPFVVPALGGPVYTRRLIERGNHPITRALAWLVLPGFEVDEHFGEAEYEYRPVTALHRVLDDDGDGALSYTMLRDDGTEEGAIVHVELDVDSAPGVLLSVDDGRYNPTFTVEDLSKVRVHEDRPLAPPVACLADETLEQCRQRMVESGELRSGMASVPSNCGRSSYPLRCRTSGVWVTSAVEVDDGIGGRRAQLNSYSPRAFDSRRGRDLGFARVLERVLVDDSPRVVEKWFDLEPNDRLDAVSGKILERGFPFAHRIAHRDTYFWPDGGHFSEASWPPSSGSVIAQRVDYQRDLQQSPDQGHPLARFTVERAEEVTLYSAAEWKPGGRLAPSEVIHHWRTSREYDDWGTLTYSSLEDLIGAYRLEVERGVSNDLDTYRVGILNREVSTSWGEDDFGSASRSTVYSYDEYNRLESLVVEPEADSSTKIELEYDAFGHIISLTRTTANLDRSTRPGEPTELVRKLMYEYGDEEAMFRTRVTDSVGLAAEYRYDPGIGNVVGSTDANGNEEVFVFDGFGNLVLRRTSAYEEEYQIGSSSLASACYWTSVRGENRPLTTTHYDCLDRPVREVTVDGSGREITSTTEYDRHGRVVRAGLPTFDLVPSEHTSWTYDGLGRAIRRENADGSEELWNWLGRRLVHTNALGGTDTVEFDSMGRVGRHTVGVDRQETVVYYGPFSLRQLVKRGGHSTRYEYTHQGQVSFMRHPDFGDRTFVRNGFGEVEQERSAAGIRDFDYDPLGRLVYVDDGDAVAEFDYDTSLHGAHRVGETRRTDSNGTTLTKYTYDAVGRATNVQTAINGREYQVETTYEDGLVRTVEYNGTGMAGAVLNFDYDAVGGVARVYGGHLHDQQQLFRSVARDDPHGRFTQYQAGFMIGRSFDSATGRLASLQVDSDSEMVASHVYSYAANGFLQEDSDAVSGHRIGFEYDALGRLTEYARDGVPQAAYSYDDLGNQLTGSSTVRRFDQDGRPHTLDYADGVEYFYDDAGRRVEDSTGWRAGYTLFDLPSELVDTSGEYTFSYNAYEDRSFRLSSDGTSTFYPEGDFIQTVEDSGAKTVIPVVVEGIRVAELSDDGSAVKVRWVVEDAMGSSLVSMLGDEITVSSPSDPYGYSDPVARDGERFAGHDYESTQINAGGRIYDPRTGTFLTPDPYLAVVGEASNPYQYANWNPLSYTDPTGFVTSRDNPNAPSFGDLPAWSQPLQTVPLDGPAVVELPGAGGADATSAGQGASGTARGSSVAARRPEWFDGIPLGALESVSNAVAGFGDAITFGLTGLARSTYEGGDPVDTESLAYTGGSVGGEVFWMAAGGGMAAVSGRVVTGGLRRSGARGVVARVREGASGELRSTIAHITRANLRGGTGTTRAARAFARRLGRKSDDAGHAIARRLGGSGGARSGNIFPQSPHINRGQFRDWERTVAGMVEEHGSVVVRVVPRYLPGSTRPHQILYQVRANGRTFTRLFGNP